VVHIIVVVVVCYCCVVSLFGLCISSPDPFCQRQMLVVIFLFVQLCCCTDLYAVGFDAMSKNSVIGKQVWSRFVLSGVIGDVNHSYNGGSADYNSRAVFMLMRMPPYYLFNYTVQRVALNPFSITNHWNDIPSSTTDVLYHEKQNELLLLCQQNITAISLKTGSRRVIHFAPNFLFGKVYVEKETGNLINLVAFTDTSVV
jgi:hypothetical protein